MLPPTDRSNAPGRHLPHRPGFSRDLRQWIQIVFLVATIVVGIQFAVFIHQAIRSGPVTIQRPAGVEGFLPIGALMGWKLFLTTGQWDPNHPAAMVILGFAAFICFMLRKSFCSWICPVGCLSEWMWRLGRRILGRNFRPPAWIDIILRGFKYALLVFFIWVILSMDSRAIFEFLQSPYYKISDVKMLHFFTRMSVTTSGVLLFLVIGSLFTRNFWCRYLCPYGALMGLVASIGPSHVHRRADTCINCGRCQKNCPYHLTVDRKDMIVSPECTACLECIQSCPIQGTLSLETIGLKNKGWTVASLGIAIVLTFMLSVYTARLTGHWHSRMQIAEYQHLLKQMDSSPVMHPSVKRR